jgi:hypothetical protein
MERFKDADVVVLVGARPRGPGMERADLLQALDHAHLLPIYSLSFVIIKPKTACQSAWARCPWRDIDSPCPAISMKFIDDVCSIIMISFALILVHSGEDGILLMLDSTISIYGRLGSWGHMERLRWEMHWSHPIVVLTRWPKSANLASPLLLHETLLKVDGCLVDLVQFFTFYLLCDLDIVEKLF